MHATTVRSILTPKAGFRILVGWGSVLLLGLLEPLLQAPVPGPLLVTTLAAIIAVILLCSFGVVHEAEQLARRLGDPYGSLVLTLSIVLIEVVLISAVLLGPGEHATIARDSVMAVSMIVLNAVIGLALLLGGLRHGGLRVNTTGTSAYLGMLIVLASAAFAVPALIGSNGSYGTGQAILVAALAVLLYGFFLFQQMGGRAKDFTEVGTAVGPAQEGSAEALDPGAKAALSRPVTAILADHCKEILLRLGVLVVTVLPIVLLSHTMAALLDDGLGRAGAPVALSGILIAMIVFLPETITTIRAALGGEMQRVSNLCHGALVSTVGLTIPSVLIIGLLTGQRIVLGESPVNLLLLGVTLVLTVSTFNAKQVTALHGAAHLAVFAIYAMAVFS